jgi:hypothetical protein
MKVASGTVDLAGWRFRLARDTNHPAGERPEELITLAYAVAGGRAGRPLRRSRHASSFRSVVRKGQTPDAEVFIKLIDPPRGAARLKAMIRGSSAEHVVQATQQLNAAGFAAPPVLLYGREASTGRELLVMPIVHGDGPFKALETTLGYKRAMLRALGAEIARLHRAGFVHGDLTPYNMFVARGEPPRFIFVDHERTRLAFFAGRRRRQLRNLVQLGRFDLPGLSRTDRMRVLRGYAASLNGSSWRSLRRRAAAMLERRIRRDGLEPARRT